ncbi:hypothetical protein BB561_003689 [Smittium simulii]|uniref:Uncharacterized protein n=1 Tax=Smittium simulii TaxID=133385 RepID=A0A2T9YK06_9FUNG|nr:hypothetical protein BB561_003689 [Smittium simulii]
MKKNSTKKIGTGTCARNAGESQASDMAGLLPHMHQAVGEYTLTPKQFTQKLCWLMTICGFMRPSNIERIYDKRTIDNEEFVRLVVISPKKKLRSLNNFEKKIGRQRINKHMNSLMKLILIDKESKVPKARALGSTILSRRSQNNITNLVLGNVNSEAR